MAGQHTFSDILSKAIESSGLSLNDIVGNLSKQGLTLSAASLSYWKTGKSLPTRKSSLPVLEAIEVMCSLPAGTLAGAAQSDSQENNNRTILKSAHQDRTPDNTHTQVPQDSDSLEEHINWDCEAEREIITDTHHISADFTQVQTKVMMLSRITKPAPSYLHVSSYLDVNEEKFSGNETGISYIEGATVGEVIRHPNSQSLTLRLDLPGDRRVGDLHRVFYLPVPFHPSLPCKQSPNRHLAWPLRMYNCSIVFEGEVPNNIEWVTERIESTDISQVKQVTTQRVHPNGNTVQITLENVQGIMGYFRWS